MPIADDSFVFQRVTVGIRKPITRFRLASGRRIELVGFHLEPGWEVFNDAPILAKFVGRLYPGQSPLIVGNPADCDGPAYLCAADLYSDTPVRPGGGNYSFLTVCGMITNIDQGIRSIVGELLRHVDWESSATDDFLW